MAISENARAILEAIAKGHTYDQILLQDPAWTYHDIFKAAAEALEASGMPVTEKKYTVEEIRSTHAQAYQKWDAQQDEQLRQLFREGKTLSEIAHVMHRQLGGIKSRLAKLQLIEPAGGE